MNYQDYYKVLGIKRNASDKEIKQAYRTLARQYHPDLNDDADAVNRFRDITEAYEVLSDPAKRQRFDALDTNYHSWQQSERRSDFDWSRWTHSAPHTATQQESSGGMFSEFFRAIFGDSGRQHTASRDPFAGKQPIHGRDQEMDITITLEEAYAGVTRQIDRPHGRAFTARIPVGAQTGTRVRFAEQGEGGFAGGRSGDLYLNINVEDHPIFERRGDDLYVDIEVPLYTAVLGGDVRLTTLGGDVRLKIPPGTQSGKTIRLKDRGMPKLKDNTRHGDLYARVLIQVPEDLDEEELELFERLAELRPDWL